MTSDQSLVFFFNDTATTEIYTLSLHDALPISVRTMASASSGCSFPSAHPRAARRSEEHTSELQSRLHLVCRLLLEKKKIRGRLPYDDRGSERLPERRGEQPLTAATATGVIGAC